MKKKDKSATILEESIEKLLNENTDFDTVETYKSIRTNIMFSISKSDSGKVIAITSSNPGEGKTTTAINLAITFAQLGAKVILLDCDMRKARVHRYLQLHRTDGISNLLCGFTDFDKAVKRNVRENLDVITAGEIPPNPAELLETEELGNLLEKLKGEYDYIFIDSPPVNIVVDAVIIAKQCTGVIMVVRENETTFDMLDTAMEAIKKSNTKIIGAIALGGEGKTKKYGYIKKGRYGYRYGRRYGYQYNYRYGDDPAEEGENTK